MGLAGLRVLKPRNFGQLWRGEMAKVYKHARSALHSARARRRALVIIVKSASWRHRRAAGSCAAAVGVPSSARGKRRRYHAIVLSSAYGRVGIKHRRMHAAAAPPGALRANGAAWPLPACKRLSS